MNFASRASLNSFLILSTGLIFYKNWNENLLINRLKMYENGTEHNGDRGKNSFKIRILYESQGEHVHM